MLFQDMDIKDGRVTTKDIGKHNNTPDSNFDPEQLAMGIESEMEHTDNPEEAKEIAKDHLCEDPFYYTHLKTMENKYNKDDK